MILSCPGFMRHQGNLTVIGWADGMSECSVESAGRLTQSVWLPTKSAIQGTGCGSVGWMIGGGVLPGCAVVTTQPVDVGDGVGG